MRKNLNLLLNSVRLLSQSQLKKNVQNHGLWYTSNNLLISGFLFALLHSQTVQNGQKNWSLFFNHMNNSTLTIFFFSLFLCIAFANMIYLWNVLVVWIFLVYSCRTSCWLHSVISVILVSDWSHNLHNQGWLITFVCFFQPTNLSLSAVTNIRAQAGSGWYWPTDVLSRKHTHTHAYLHIPVILLSTVILNILVAVAVPLPPLHLSWQKAFLSPCVTANTQQQGWHQQPNL